MRVLRGNIQYIDGLGQGGFATVPATNSRPSMYAVRGVPPQCGVYNVH